MACRGQTKSFKLRSLTALQKIGLIESLDHTDTHAISLLDKIDDGDEDEDEDVW